MTVAQGINKITSLKVQTGLGVPAVGTGAQVLRRRTSVATKKRATYVNDEIVQHQQSTGVNLGTASTDWNFDGLLSPGTYAVPLAMLVRKAFTVLAPIAGLSLTVAGPTAGAYTITRAAGDFIAGGVRIGDVVRITAGTFANPVNRDNNILVTNLTATVLTGVTLNGSLLVAEGPVAASAITLIGKKTLAPLSGHLDTLATVEEWYPDLGKSEVFPDMRIGQVDIGLPASGNATVKMMGMGLGVRTANNTQQHTTPTPATTTPVLTSVRGVLLVNGAPNKVVTGVSFTMKANMTAEGPVVGSNFSPDMSRGRLEVSGQFTALFDSTDLRDLFDAETLTSLVVVMAADTTNNSDFVCFSIGAFKLTGADPDDGEKAIIRTYPFTAQLDTKGAVAGAPYDQTIVAIQDSAA